jgi:ABC-type branched-subunit amino acid transport system ATPase component
MLEIDRLSIRYGPFLALDEVSLSVNAGEIVGLIGPNGAGKSSLARAIAGLERPASGQIRFFGKVLGDVPVHERIGTGISLVPEGRGLFAQMSVEENLLMGGYTLGSRGATLAAMDRGFQLFPLLRERRRQMAGTLSGGQMQRMLFARLLLQDARVILLDEPFTALDSRTTADLIDLVGRWHVEGRTVVAVLHDFETVRAHFPKALLLARETVAWGETRSLTSAN